MCDFCQYGHKTEEHDEFMKSMSAKAPKKKEKKKVKDEPRFDMIHKYEGQFKENYKKTVQSMSKALVKKMSSYAK
jgi:hypothetical protein